MEKTMSRRTTIYPHSVGNKKNLKGIIPDKMEISINIKSFGMTHVDFRRIGQLEGYDRKGRGFSGTINHAGLTFQVHHSFISKSKSQKENGQSSFVQTTVVCSHLNGNYAYRQYYELGEPKPLSTDDKNNFVTQEEIDQVLRRPDGRDLYGFTINILPGLILKEIKNTFIDVCSMTVNQLKAIVPHADIKTVEINNNTYSFRLIEMSNNIRIPKLFSAWSVINGMPTLKIYDPLLDQNVLENLAAITKVTEEMDFKGKVPIAASRFTYVRGHRQINFVLYQHRIKGKAYLKYVHGTEYDLFRVEPTYTNQHIGKKTDVIAKVATLKSFNTADDIAKIFRRLANHTHEVTHAMFGVHYELLDSFEKSERTRKILSTQFDYYETEEILEQLNINKFKINLKNIQRPKTQSKIKGLAQKNLIFKSAYNSSGDYLFKRELLGDRETRSTAEVSP